METKDMTRNEMYGKIKEFDLANKIFELFGKHYTNISNEKLLVIISRQMTKESLINDIIEWQRHNAEIHINGVRENKVLPKLLAYTLQDWQTIDCNITTLEGVNITIETLALGYENGKYYYERLKELLNV